jgi:hypothetical protein
MAYILPDERPSLRTRGRSTPQEHADCAEVTDSRGKTWRYSEPSDTWTLVVPWDYPGWRDEGVMRGGTFPHSARSWQRLEVECGPLEAR